MRLSTVLELLLIFLFIAFAASEAHVVKKSNPHYGNKELRESNRKLEVGRQAEATDTISSTPNRYCKCTNLTCNCCREFSVPVVQLKGPGCATISYLSGDNMRLTMSFGERVLRNMTLSGRKPKPVCMSLPGGISKFCGRVYNIERDGDSQFKACLGLELRAINDIEAALRVSCFKFGPNGVRLEPGQPIPSSENDEDDDDDDDDDDDYDLDDDDDDDDDLFDDDDAENDVDSGDYTGFSALGDEFLEGFFGESSGSSNKKKKKTTLATTAQPLTNKKKISQLTTQKVITTTNAPKKEDNLISEDSNDVVEQPVTVQQNETPINNEVENNLGITENEYISEKNNDEENYTTEEEHKENNTGEEPINTEENTNNSNEEKEHTDTEVYNFENETGGHSDIIPISSELGKRIIKKFFPKLLENRNPKSFFIRGVNVYSEKVNNPPHEVMEAEIQVSPVDNNESNIAHHEVILNVKETTTEKQLNNERRISINANEMGSRERMEKMFPGLWDAVKSPILNYDPNEEHSFPAARSARVHKRMRLPPL